MGKRKIKVVERKLLREQAWGTVNDKTGLIELDVRLSEPDRLVILCHEAAHLADDTLTERQVCRLGKLIGGILWSQGYRRVRQ